MNASNDQPDYEPDRDADNQNREWRRKYKGQFLEHVRSSHRNFHGASFHAFVNLAPCEEIIKAIAPQCSLTLFPRRWNKDVDSAPIGVPGSPPDPQDGECEPQQQQSSTPTDSHQRPASPPQTGAIGQACCACESRHGKFRFGVKAKAPPAVRFYTTYCPVFASAASSRRQPHVDLAPRRLGVTQQRLGARQRLAALQPGDGGLAGTHPGSELGLGQAGAQASPQQLGGNLELGGERVVFGLDLGISEQTSLELLEPDRHVTSFARRRAQGHERLGIGRSLLLPQDATQSLTRS